MLVQTAGLTTTEQNGAWYSPFANVLKEKGIADEISPNEPITRLELVEWTLRSMGGEQLMASEICTFSDLKNLTESEKNMVAVADEIGLISGYPDGTFRPHSTYTRAEAFAILCGYSAASEKVEARLQPTISGGATQQMSVSLDAPSTAETYSPVEVRVVSKNAQSLDWTVSGYQDEVAVTTDNFESSLGANGGEITFFQPGSYTLKAVATSKSGQKSEYVLTISVTEQPIRLSAPSEVPVYVDARISAFVRSDITDLAWSVTRDGEDVSDKFSEILSADGGALNFKEDGIYKFTLMGKNGLGEAVSATCEVLAYQQYYGCVTGTQTAFVGEDAYYGTSHFYLPESVSAEWQVLENGEVLDWDSVIDGEIENYYGGTVKFMRTGDFTVRLSVTDRLNHVTGFDVNTTVYEPIDFALSVPETACVGEKIRASVSGLGENYEPVSWTAYGATVENGDRTGCDLTYNSVGTHRVTISVPHEKGVTYTKYADVRVEKKNAVLPDPTFTLPEVAYTETAFAPTVTADIGPCEIAWSFADESGKTVRTFSVEGGTITANAAGNYTVTATISDGVGHTNSHSEKITVREKPHIRMNPLNRETMEERLNYVNNLHLGTSDTSYPTFKNTSGMTVKFELFEGSELADETAAYFTPRENSYTFQPKRVGNFSVRATATDEFSNSFSFETKYHVVPVVSAEIIGLSDTAIVNETLAVGITQHNMNGEAVTWKLAKISEEDAEPYLNYGLSNLWLMADGWQEIEFDSVCTANLTDLGGEISFFRSGIYCLRTEATDEYDKTTERYKVIKVEGV